jgi:hypothetical protein
LHGSRHECRATPAITPPEVFRSPGRDTFEAWWVLFDEAATCPSWGGGRSAGREVCSRFVAINVAFHEALRGLEMRSIQVFIGIQMLIFQRDELT